jgi:hypothetical protein
MAAYEGKGRGRLGGALSVSSTAQADGSFELAGLTPGRYTLQAALDDIWLSPSTTLEVGDRSPPTVTLAMPPPGGAAVVEVVGRDGAPLPGRVLTIDRPGGPLAAALWPTRWTADGAGEVYVPAVEAGRHTVRVAGSAAVAEVVIPALPAERPVRARLTVPTPAAVGR